MLNEIKHTEVREFNHGGNTSIRITHDKIKRSIQAEILVNGQYVCASKVGDDGIEWLKELKDMAGMAINNCDPSLPQAV